MAATTLVAATGVLRFAFWKKEACTASHGVVVQRSQALMMPATDVSFP